MKNLLHLTGLLILLIFTFGSCEEYNQPPLVSDQVVYLDENPTANFIVDTVDVLNNDTHKKLKFSIIAGNENNAFVIDSLTGIIWVNDSTQINFEINPLFEIEVAVENIRGLKSTVTITININNIAEPNTVNPINLTLEPNYDIYTNKTDSIYLDIDNDKNIDATFVFSGYQTYKVYNESITVKALNDFEIAKQNGYRIDASDFNQFATMIVDTVIISIPNAFDVLDTISDLSDFTNHPIQLCSRYRSYYNSYTTTRDNNYWCGIGERFIGLRNKQKKIYCWIKIEVLSCRKIKIMSYYYTMNQTELVINM